MATELRTKPTIETASHIATTLTVNGHDHALMIEPRRTLLDALRHDLAMTGTKKVCDMGNCGACTVIVDGRAMYSCLLLAVDCDGREITTIEGVADGNDLDPLQQAFIDKAAVQCGFCIPGMLMAGAKLLDEHADPTLAEIQVGLSGNICRCTGYRKILDAVQAAATEMSR